MMRTIQAAALTDAVAKLCIQANTHLPADIVAALDATRQGEPWPLAKETLGLLWENMELAEESADSYILLAVNSTETEQSGVLKAVVDIPASDDFAGFTITDAAGSPVEYALLSKERTHRDVFSPIDRKSVV